MEELYHAKMTNSLITFVPQVYVATTKVRGKHKVSQEIRSLYALILKNGYSIPAQLYILLPASTYCLILLIVAEKSKWQRVNLNGHTW
jgi:hypothetical protein